MLFKSIRVIVYLIIATQSVSVLASKKDDFREAYSAYQHHIEAGNIPQALDAAAEALKLGKKVYGKNDVNTARLAINYATLLNDTDDFKNARKVLKGRLKVLEAEHGNDDGELTSLLIELGRADLGTRRPETALAYFDRASMLLENEQNAFYRGVMNFDILTLLLKQNAHRDSRRFTEQAYLGFSQSLQPNDIRLGLAAYHMALWSAADNRNDDAVNYLNESLTAFVTEDGQMTDVERTVRTMLVNSLEMSDKSELATQHCLALGRGQEWQTPAKPVFMVQPGFSPGLAKEVVVGEVIVNFTVDAQGFVRDANIASSSAPGLNQAALDGISRFRYAPRFVDGAPVATPDVNFRVSFDFTEALAAGKSKGRQSRFSVPPLRQSAAGGSAGSGGGGMDADFGGGGGEK